MKRIILIVIANLICSICTFAANREHLIERGETLESIARKYNVSVQSIMENNPDVANMFYAGMVLEIPESNSVTYQENTFSSVSEPQSKSRETYSDPKIEENKSNAQYSSPNLISSNYSEDEESAFQRGRKHWGFDIAYLFLKGGEVKTQMGNSQSTSFGLTIDFTAKFSYYLINNLSLDALAGYEYMISSATSRTEGIPGSESYDSTCHLIPVSIRLGYTFPFKKSSGIKLYVGPSMSIPVANSIKFNNKKIKNSSNPDTSFTLDAGAELILNQFCIGGGIAYNLNKSDDLIKAMGIPNWKIRVSLGTIF